MARAQSRARGGTESMLLRARSGQASGLLTQALRWGWRGHFGGPQGPVQRLGCLEKGGSSSQCLAVQVVDRQAEWPGAQLREGGLCRGSPTVPGLVRLGPPFPAVCPVQENAAPAEQCPGSLGPGCALWGSSVGTEPEEAWGAGCLPRMILCASSVSPRPPRQTALSTRLGHCLEGAQMAS